MTTSPAHALFSRRTALVGLGGSTIGLALATFRASAFAQESTPIATIAREGHPLVGAWEVNEADYSSLSRIDYAVFTQDGTWLHYSPPFLAIGVWRPTGARTGEGVEIYQFLESFERLFDLASPVPEDALKLQPLKFRFDAEVDTGGNAFKMSGFVVDEQGNDQPGYAGEIAGIRSGTATPTS